MLMLSQTVWAQTLYTPFPSSFRNTKDNEIEGGIHLRSVFQKLKANRRVKVMHIGDSHVKGNYLPRSFEKTLKGYFPTVEFAYYGINGAWARRFYENDMVQRVAMEHPDLVVVSFGTNEAHAGAYEESAHTQSMKLLTQRIREACPGVSFLFTTPPGSYIAQRTGATYTTGRGRHRRTHYRTVKSPNQKTERVANNIVTFCVADKCAVWDLYSIVGGNANACTNWYNAGLMNTDQVHYLVAGYNLQGTLLGEALHKAYMGTGPSGSSTHLYQPPTPQEHKPYSSRKGF